jgi:hypothetical protein
MSKHTILPFIKWLFKKIFGSVIRLYQSYDSMVSRDPLLAFLPTLFIGMIGMVAIVFYFIINKAESLYQVWYTMLAFETILFVNYFRIIIREQYKAYQEEQQRLIDTLSGKS